MPTEAASDQSIEIPEGILQARSAFLRNFDQLYSDRKIRGKFVCFHRDQLVAVSTDYMKLIREVVARDIPDQEYLVFKVTPAERIEEQALESQIFEL